MNQHSTMLQVACVEQRWHPQFAEVTAEAEEKRQNTDTDRGDTHRNNEAVLVSMKSHRQSSSCLTTVKSP